MTRLWTRAKAEDAPASALVSHGAADWQPKSQDGQEREVGEATATATRRKTARSQKWAANGFEREVCSLCLLTSSRRLQSFGVPWKIRKAGMNESWKEEIKKVE